MKYTGKEISKKESVKKHAEHIKKNDVVFATSDGNAFIGSRAKSVAHSHAANYRPALDVFDLKNESAESGSDTTEEVTLTSLMKLTAPNLKLEADKLEVVYESDANKETVANAILEKLAEPAEE